MDEPTQPAGGQPGNREDLEARIREEVDRRLKATASGSQEAEQGASPQGTPSSLTLPASSGLPIFYPTGVVELKVKTVALDSESKGPVMILTDRQERLFLPIWIGKFEGDALIAETEGRPADSGNRPMTHDLFHQSLVASERRVTRASITNLVAHTYFAELHLDNGAVLDARPSDSIILAVKFKAPIFAAESVVQKAAIFDRTKETPEERAAGRIELS